MAPGIEQQVECLEHGHLWAFDNVNIIIILWNELITCQVNMSIKKRTVSSL